MRGRDSSDRKSLTRNVLPFPTSLWTVMSPPMILVSRLVIVSPSPVPIVAKAPNGACPLERLKNPFQVAVVNADAGVFDRKRGDLVMIANSKRHMSGIGELDGVGKEIDQNLPQPIFVGLNRSRQTSSPLVAEFDAFRGRLQAEHGGDLVEEIRRVHLIAAEMKTARLLRVQI
jgi:hypothetical protein